MNRPTLLCHMEVNCPNKAVLSVSADLAAALNAAVIGIAACQPVQPFGEMPYAGDILAADIAEIRRETAEAEQAFRGFMDGRVRNLSFRSAATYQELADYIAGQGRAADFIVTGPDLGGSLLNNSRHTNVGDLVMNAGRPVILVPKDAAECLLGSVVVAWKDRREARRALLDALPILRHARQVTVAEVAHKSERDNAIARTTDVAAWLERHGIKALPLVRAWDGPDVECLQKLLDEKNCDFLVAGAYSHSRIGEWAFGGVTTDLLLQPNRCTLISH
jgi:nucleotide-binding universal stress UspA family protein